MPTIRSLHGYGNMAGAAATIVLQPCFPHPVFCEGIHRGKEMYMYQGFL